MNYPGLTNKVSPKEYAIAKVHLWLELLNHGKRPVRWTKPTRNGTNVTFNIIRTQLEYDNGLKELQDYINRVNEEFDLDITLGPKR